MAKRLFYVKDTVTGKRLTLEGAGKSPDFSCKADAKKLRNEMNEGSVPENRCVVARGVDHVRGKT